MKVFGHRGADGYFPENTIESFAAAFDMGVDAVELDVVPSGDGVLVVRHEGNLELTTDVVERPHFQHLASDDGTDGLTWLVERFSFSDIQSLHARERYPSRRLASSNQDDLYRVPSLRDVLRETRFSGKHFIVELKHAAYYKRLGLDMVAMLEDELLSYALPAGINLSVETFDWNILLELKEVFADLEVIYALDGSHFREQGYESIFAPGAIENLFDRLTAAEISSLSCGFDLLFDPGVVSLEDMLNRPNAFFDAAAAAGIPIYGFTAADDRMGIEGVSPEDYWKMVAATRFDGVYADQPDRLLKALGR